MVERDHPTQDMLFNNPSIEPVRRGQVRKGHEAAAEAMLSKMVSITHEVRKTFVTDASSSKSFDEQLQIRVDETFLRRRSQEPSLENVSAYLPACDMKAYHMHARERLKTRGTPYIAEALQPGNYWLEISQLRISPVLDILLGEGRLRLDAGRLDIPLAPPDRPNKFFDGPDGKGTCFNMPVTNPPCQSIFIHQSDPNGGLEFMEEIQGDA